jgi:transcriptional regulator with AAA-type ATPase domain
MLQDKIKEYLDNHYFFPGNTQELAKDIAETCISEYGNITNYSDESFTDGCDNYLANLEKENIELKESLDNAYGVRDDALDNQKKLKQENRELKNKIKRLEANEIIYHERLKR